MRHARGRKLESGVQKNRSIKPKIRWKEKGLPDVWQGQHQVLEVQQALTGSYHSQKSFQAPVPHGPGAFSVAGRAGAARGRPPRYPPVRCGAPLPGPAAGAAQPGAPPPVSAPNCAEAPACSGRRLCF